MRKASGLVIARPRRGRGTLSAKREEVPLGCNLGKAAAFSPMAFPQFGRVLRDCHVGLRPPRNDKLDGIAPMNLCRKYCHPAGRSLSAIGSCRYCSSDSVAQGSRICHCEAPKGPWQSREGSCVFADGFPVIWSGTARLPRAQSALAMTNRGPVLLSRWPASIGAAAPGRAVPACYMFCAGFFRVNSSAARTARTPPVSLAAMTGPSMAAS